QPERRRQRPRFALGDHLCRRPARPRDRLEATRPPSTPLAGCFINCGWGTGGFKAIPGSGWATAEMIAKGEPGPLAAAFGLERFREGRFIDESVAAGVAH
ncbi:MAG: hypothetical protein AAFR34_07695, partial [Pseudomonadota bacterium]